MALDRTSGTSLQDQIVAFFRDAVLRGALKAGARLPSSRRLAADLGVARITAVEAFDRLAEPIPPIFSRCPATTM